MQTKQLYMVTGNTKPKRLGRVFPTGWTPVSRPGEPLLIAASKWPNTLRGTKVEHCGEMDIAEVAKRQRLDLMAPQGAERREWLASNLGDRA